MFQFRKSAVVASLTLSAVLFSSSIPIRASEPEVSVEDFLKDLDLYISQAQGISNLIKFVDNSEESEKSAAQPDILALTEALKAHGARVASLYFDVINEKNLDSTNAELMKRLKAHEDLKTYFVFLGNAMNAEARSLETELKMKRKRITLWAAAGGGVVGLVAGVALYRFSVTWGRQYEAIGFRNGAMAFFAITAVATLGGAGVSYLLPVRDDIESAQDFLDRYPHGENFFESDGLPKSSDVTLNLPEMDPDEEAALNKPAPGYAQDWR